MFFRARGRSVVFQHRTREKKHLIATSPRGPSSTRCNSSGWFVGRSGTPPAVSLRYIRDYVPDTPKPAFDTSNESAAQTPKNTHWPTP